MFSAEAAEIAVALVVGEDDDEVRPGGVYMRRQSRKQAHCN